MLATVGPGTPVAGRRVVVTGVGAVTAAGSGADVLFKTLCEGVAPESTTVRGFEPEALFGPKDARRLDRFSQYTLAAALEAFERLAASRSRTRLAPAPSSRPASAASPR